MKSLIKNIFNPKRNLFINSNLYKDLIGDERISILDGGSRGKIFEPFDKVNENRILVIKFDADPDAEQIKSENSILVPNGLWNKEEAKILYLANEPTTSSLYPPNKEILEIFENRIGYPPRATKKKVSIEGIGIDECVKKGLFNNINFIKLDIHGAEYEALEGAINTIKNDTVGILVEGWQIPIHSGQKLLFEVDKLLFNLGFPLFSRTQSISWKKKEHIKSILSKNQLICEENLYFRWFDLGEDKLFKYNKINAIKLIALTELYGHVDSCLHFLLIFKNKNIITEIEYNHTKQLIIKNNKKTFINKIGVKIKELANMID